MFADPENYRAMSVPHESSEALDRAIQGFFADLRELRKKHKLANVHIVLASPYITADGNEAEAAICAHIGDSNRAAGMAAFGYGFEKRQQQADLDALAATAGDKLRIK